MSHLLQLEKISGNDPGKLGIISHLYDNELNFMSVEADAELEVGEEYILTLKYTGYLNTNMRGFYRSSYENENGETV